MQILPIQTYTNLIIVWFYIERVYQLTDEVAGIIIDKFEFTHDTYRAHLRVISETHPSLRVFFLDTKFRINL